MLSLFSTRPLFHRFWVQYAFDPPRRFSKVALSWWPGAFALHVIEVWPLPPWVQRYFSVFLRGRGALSGVFSGLCWVRPVLLRVLAFFGGWSCTLVDMLLCILWSNFKISSWVVAACVAFAWWCSRVGVLRSESASDGVTKFEYIDVCKIDIMLLSRFCVPVGLHDDIPPVAWWGPGLLLVVAAPRWNLSWTSHKFCLSSRDFEKALGDW